ncbi:MAG: hypothetical protein AAF202_00595 [Pseudomonadota bacterium]
MDKLSRLFMIGFAIAMAHAVHLRTLGTEQVIIGAVNEEYRYPPKSVLRWYLKSFESLEPQIDQEVPFNLAMKRCAQFDPLSIDCLKLFELMKAKGNVDYNAHSAKDYKFPPIYIAIMNCNEDAIHYLRARRQIDVDTKPGPGPYQSVNTLQFLYSTECPNKPQLKEALYGLRSDKYVGNFLEGGSWNEAEIFE